MTDAELIEATRRGEREAYGVLVERHQRMVEAVAYAAAGDRAIVDDVVQDSFVAAWQQLDRLRDPARFRPWLCGIAMNLARKARRRRGREADLVEVAGGETPFEAAAEREREREVAAALASLSPRYREPLVLFYYEQCSVKEVAAALAIREDAAMQRLSRGRQQLGDAIAARVEASLERRPSRKAVAAAVLATLPLLHARWTLAAVAARDAAASKSAAWAGALIGAIVARGRLVATTLAVAAIVLIVVSAARTSERVAAARSARESPAPLADAAVRIESRAARVHAPHLPEPRSSSLEGRIHRNIAVASPDPVETCRRGVHGLVAAALGDNHGIVLENGRAMYHPDPIVERIADELGDKIGETCAGTPWPELYVICEGTTMDVLDGSVSCYPYDPFE